mgnify:FL=1
MFLLKDKTVLITGASGGIGQEVARHMSKQGADIILTGTNEEKLKKISSDLGQKSKYIVADLGNDQDIDNLSQNAENYNGKIDILVNNAGITSDNLFLRMKDEEWDKVLNINLNSNVKLTKKIIRGMIKRRFGRIIFITSIIGFSGNAGQSNYASSKAALSGFSKSIALEVANRGITSNLIAPGYIQTPMTEKLNEDQKNNILEKIPVSRLGEPQDIASACVYLASDEASFVTGSTLHVNGGMGMF